MSLSLLFAWHVYINGVECDPAQAPYAGLAYSDPALNYPGLYQVTVTVPSGTGSGDLPLEIVLDEGTTLETTIAVGAVPAASPHKLTRQ